MKRTSEIFIAGAAVLGVFILGISSVLIGVFSCVATVGFIAQEHYVKAISTGIVSLIFLCFVFGLLKETDLHYGW